jgi:hypothetical protein
MKICLWGIASLALVATGSAGAGDIEFKPINTQKLVVQPSKAAAGLAAQSISLVGQAAGNTIEKNGYVKTINNLFGKKIFAPRTQAGPSPLPTPTMFSSTQYKSYNTPLMPRAMPRR